MVYCDPPYKNTLKYKEIEEFDYEYFKWWLKELAVNNTVLLSEYTNYNNYEILWKKTHYVNLASQRTSKEERIEYLFKVE